MGPFWVYVLENPHGRFYVGSTDNLKRRLAEHNDKLPSVDENGRLDTANFVRRFTGRTDEDGKLNAAGNIGPYLARFPSNPFGSVDADKIVFGTDHTPPGKGGGWYFNTRTGKFSANDPDNKGL